MATTFSAAMEKVPLRPFQIATFAVCMLVLTCDGIDQQLLGIIAPKVLPHLNWIAWASLGCSIAAISCWTLSRRWHDRAVPHPA